ncbi:MAG: hypothetical protein KGI98_17685 [Euryarchaeota archaeon]|nr:hypothetical protein [Euryarchaeota archaeon]
MSDAEPKSEVVHSFKGFDKDLKCKGFQFALGETYEHSGAVVACKSGFRACEYPLDVLRYHPPATSRYAEVVQSGAIERHDTDSEIASATITIGVELRFYELIQRAVKWVFDRAKLESGSSATGYCGAASARGDRGAASATGYCGAASATGYCGAASATGDRGAASATGYYSAASATGYYSAASATGDRGAASATSYCGAASATGYYSAASATGYYGAASATGDYSAVSATGYCGAASATGARGAASATGARGAASATGYYSAASATGYCGAASATGYCGAASATGDYSAVMSSGRLGRVKGANGCALFLVRRDDEWKITHAWAGIVGHDGIKPDTFYTLDDNGLPRECDD